MQREARSRRLEAVRTHPVAELMACPPGIGMLLNGAARSMNFSSGDLVFRQDGLCQGLYLVLSGRFLRRTERLEAQLTLGPARVGDLVELAAALGEPRHTYSLVAQSAGSLLMLPIDALQQAFQSYAPLRMHLLEELAREVSRAYYNCFLHRNVRIRRGIAAA